jgi:hypothetical protein
MTGMPALESVARAAATIVVCELRQPTVANKEAVEVAGSDASIVVCEHRRATGALREAEEAAREKASRAADDATKEDRVADAAVWPWLGDSWIRRRWTSQRRTPYQALR